MLVRTQVQLTEEQLQALKGLAKERGISIAELIRQSVDQFIQSPQILTKEDRIERAMSVVGKFHSGHHDISENHDRYLDDIYHS